MTRVRLTVMLATLAGAAFLLSTAGIALSPFLQTIADEFDTGLVAVTGFVSIMAVSWGVGSLFIGPLSDRVGRRPVLVTAVLAMSGAQYAFSQADDYGVAVVCQILTGFSGGAYMGTVFAAVSDQVSSGRRGRALGWVVTGQSLSLVLGVPLVALLGAAGGWREALTLYAATVAATALLVYLTVPADRPRRATPERERPRLSGLLRVDILLLLGAGIAERTCFAAIAVYLALYLQTSYGVSLTQLAGGLALVAFGNVVGNMLGGQLTDRLRARMLIYVLSALSTAALALPLMFWRPGLAVSLALGFCYSLANAAGRPALMTALSEVPAGLRGAVFGLNITSASVGWLAAAALGGWLVTQAGFGALGVLCAAASSVGALLGFCHWRRA